MGLLYLYSGWGVAWRGVDDPHPSSTEKEYSYIPYLLNLWAFMACSEVNLTFTLKISPLSLLVGYLTLLLVSRTIKRQMIQCRIRKDFKGLGCDVITVPVFASIN
jgi:hypothetical protein